MTTRRPQTGEPLATQCHRVGTRPPSPLQVLGVVERTFPDLPVIYHDTRDGDGAGSAFVALGEAVEPDSRGTLEDRLAALRAQLDDQTRGSGDLPLFFHLGFDRDEAVEHWTAFDPVSTTCPRVVFRWDGDQTELQVTRLQGAELDDRFPVQGEASIDELVSSARRQETANKADRDLEVSWPGIEQYRHAVGNALEALDGSTPLQKVVLARSGVATDSRPLSPTSALDSLNRRYGAARHFAVAPSGLAGGVFLGASPERLIQSSGREVRTMALAGTREREVGRDPQTIADELMASSKDRSEHGYVTRMIRESLENLGAQVDVADTPTPMVLANVIHLETPIRARFEGSKYPNLGRLVEALHPTPAVCGTPTEDARNFIREYEGLERGLYAGVLGWQTADGGGDTTVALRCGLLEGRRARIYAGGGVTAESDIDEEFDETSAKFNPMLQALRSAGVTA